MSGIFRAALYCFVLVRVNSPTPAIVAQSAVRPLPRLALLLLCVAYVVPGFIGRAAWKNDDVTAFGYMLSLARGHSSWSQPLLLGLAPETEGLLPYWLGAAALQIAPDWMSPELAARIPFAMLLALTLVATWYAVYHLARGPGAQPVAFAFGGEAQPTDYARAMADGGLLALIACLGLAQLSHEVTAYLTQLCCAALVFYAIAGTPYRWLGPGLGLVAGMAGLVLSGAPALAVLFGLGGAWLCMFEPHEDAAARRRAYTWAAAMLLTSALAAILAWQLDLWRWRLMLPGDGGKEWQSLGRLLLWFTWPAWPLALWTLWRWRHQWASRTISRHLALPLWFASVAIAATLFTVPHDRALLLGLPALATLAAFALPTLSRSVAALIDWFTLLFFTGIAIVVWVSWIAMQTGFPAKPAANVAKLAPGFEPSFSLVAFLVALAATLVWAWLVQWRAGRHRAAIWKSLVLPAGGAALGWLLLMTLWMPLLDFARSYAPQVSNVTRIIGLPHPECVEVYALNRGQITALQHHGNFTLQHAKPQAQCPWLVADESRTPRDTAIDAAQWTFVGKALRPADKNDNLLLYRRIKAPH